MLRKEMLNLFQVEFLSDNFFTERSCGEFHEYIVLALVLKQPYFWVQEVGMLRRSLRDQQVLYLCRFPENIN